MAILLNNNKDDEKESSEGSVIQPPQINTGATGAIGPSAPATPTANQNQQKQEGTSSGSFTNLKTYLNANKNFNKDGGGLAGKVVQNIDKQGQQVTQNVANAVQNFNNTAQQQVNTFKSAVPLLDQAKQDAAKVAQDANNVAQIQSAVNAEYTGPKSLNDLEGKENQGALQAQTQDFNTKVSQGQTEGGRFNLLRNMFGRPKYTAGQQSLDNLLIQGQKDQIQKLADSRKVAANVSRSLNDNIAAAEKTGQQAVADVANVRDTARSTLNSAIDSQNNTIADRLAKLKQAQDERIGSLKTQLGTKQVADADLTPLGLASGTKTWGADLASLVKASDTPTAERVATAEDYAKISALKKLLGGAVGENQSKVVDQFADDSKASTYDLNKAVDMNNLRTSVQDAISKGKSTFLDEAVNTIRGTNFGTVPVLDERLTQAYGHNVYNDVAANDEQLRDIILNKYGKASGLENLSLDSLREAGDIKNHPLYQKLTDAQRNNPQLQQFMQDQLMPIALRQLIDKYNNAGTINGTDVELLPRDYSRII